MIKSGDNYVWNETYVSVMNQTSTPLGIGESFTGAWERVGDKTSALVRIFSDQKCEYYLEFSPNKTLITSSIKLNFDPSRINVPNRFTIGDDYYRLRIVNTSGFAMTQLVAQTLIGIKELLNFPLDGRLPQKADSLSVRPISYEDEVSLGLREGKFTVNKFGKNTDLDTGTELIAPYGGSLVVLSAAEQLSIVSTSADDAPGGTGTSQIIIEAVNGDWDLDGEVVTLNGTTPVLTTKSYLGVNRIRAIASGTNLSNVGTITATNNITGNIAAQVDPNDGGSLQCLYYIPRNYDYVVKWIFFNCRKLAGGTAPRVLFDLNEYNSTFNTIRRRFPIRLEADVTNEDEVDLITPERFSEKTIIFATATTNVNDTIINYRFNGILYQRADIVV